MKHSRASLPGPLRNSRASASVVEACVSLRRRSRWKSRSPLRPGPDGSPEPSFGRKLLAGPGFQQSTVDREMLARQQSLDLVLRQHRDEKLARHLAIQQPVAVLGEAAGIPHRILDAKSDKPAEQQVVVDALDQLTLRADRIKGLQQQGSHQPLRRDRLPPDWRIQRVKIDRQRPQRRVGDLADHPQRMIRSHPLLQVDVAEQTTAVRVVAAHRYPPNSPGSGNQRRSKCATFFSTLLVARADEVIE
jgi:hypothetical protein